jgi:hypothetical protein
MKQATLLLVIFGLAAGLPALSGHGEEPKKDKELSDLMKRKLENSQKVLEGVAMNDFDKIS